MAKAKFKFARQLSTGDKVILKDGKAKITDIQDVKRAGVIGKSGHIVVLKIENLEGSNRGKIVEFPVFANDNIELVPKREKRGFWSRFFFFWR